MEVNCPESRLSHLDFAVKTSLHFHIRDFNEKPNNAPHFLMMWPSCFRTLLLLYELLFLPILYYCTL